MTREQIEARIKYISEVLKGYGISQGERMLLNEDRRDLRAMLRALDEHEL